MYPPNLDAFHQIYLDRSQRAVAAADAHRQARPRGPHRGIGPWLSFATGLVRRHRSAPAAPPVTQLPPPRLRSV
jgi:hypothetical protein